MDQLLLSAAIWKTLGAAVLLSLLNTVCIGILSYVVGFRVRDWIVLIFSLSLLGITAGWLTGNSRDPAVGAVVPAMLTFVGGLSTYIAIQKSERQKSTYMPTVVASCTLALAGMFFLGTLWGATNRSVFDDPEVKFQQMLDEEQNRFRLELHKQENDRRLKSFE